MRPTCQPLVLVSLLLLLLTSSSRADLLSDLGLSRGKTSTNQPGVADLSGLSQDQIIQGLKQALAKGLQHAVGELGHDGGFLTNLNVKIPMPEKLRSVEKTMRSLKQDKLADDFINTMNRAAEQAVPEAGAVFAD